MFVDLSDISTQLTITSSLLSQTKSTLPIGFDKSTRIGFSKELPSSSENDTFTVEFAFGAVYQAIATLLPRFDNIGPLTGQPVIFQLSSLTG